MSSSLKLYMIPGTGTDSRIYAPQLEAFPDMIVPEWLPPLQLKETLDDYALRLSKTIDASGPFVLGGVSLGGMIAQQIALKLRPQALILIATCNSCKALPLSMRLSGKVMRMLPDGVIAFIFKHLAKLVMAGSSRRKAVYAAMLREMPPRLVRWQSGAATEWRLKGTLTVPVFQIHGEKDRVIPIANITAQKMVPDGGHLINVTHEQVVNAFILESVNKILQSNQNSIPETISARLRLH